MTPEDLFDPLPQMEVMLQHSRRCIVRAHIAMRLKRGLKVVSVGILVMGACFALLRFLGWSFGVPAPTGVHILWAAFAFGGAVGINVIWNIRRGVSVRSEQVAERLDLSQETHNKIATAISFLKSGDDSPFACAAIRDGQETLEHLKDKRPVLRGSDAPQSHFAWALILGVALMVAGLFLSPKSGSMEVVASETDLVAAVAEGEADMPPDPRLPEKSDKREFSPEESANLKPDGRTVIKESPPARAGIPQKKDPSMRSEGKMGRHSSAESKKSQSASKSSSSASGGAAKSKAGESEPSKPKSKKAKPKDKVAKKPKDEKEQKQGGSISSRGASGSSSSSTAQNEWASKVKAKADDGSDRPQEDEPDEEADPDKLRPGSQPALKNRSARISRELSLMTGSETANKQNRGRGGPGGQKKSRGTATMIMGVPVPGFVRGRLLPGPTKTTQEEVEPTPRAGEYTLASSLPKGQPEEDVQENFRPSLGLSEQARNYLIQYHAEHENKRQNDPSGE